MPITTPTAEPRMKETRQVPLWALVLAFCAGLALLGLLKPAAARAQTAADSTVLLNWTAPGDDATVGRATSYDIRYRTVAISGTDTTSWWNAATMLTGEPLPGVAGATDSMRVRGLAPLSTYYFMVRAADEVPNWSGYSNIAVKATGGDGIPPAAIAALSVTGTSITVRWTAPGDNGTTGTASSYDVRYSTTAITSANWGSALLATGEPGPTAAGTTQTFTVGGLTGSRTYYVAMKTTDDYGNVSLLSNVVSGTTSDTVAPAAVRDLSYGDPAGGPLELLAAADASEFSPLP
jgi:hypothetical protein